MKKIKIGFVGAGRVTIHHIKLLKKLQTKIRIVAICDLIESKCDGLVKTPFDIPIILAPLM